MVKTRTSSAPNVQTMAAPEGRSHQNEKKKPATPPIKRDEPTDQQSLPSRVSRQIDSANRRAQSDN